MMASLTEDIAIKMRTPDLRGVVLGTVLIGASCGWVCDAFTDLKPPSRSLPVDSIALSKADGHSRGPDSSGPVLGVIAAILGASLVSISFSGRDKIENKER
jgi:hypothetical protein